MAQFLLNGFESEIIVFISEREDGSNHWVDDSSMRTVDLDDASQGLNDSCVLYIRIFVAFKRLAFLNKHVQNFECAYFSFQLLCISCHVVQNGYKVRQ